MWPPVVIRRFGIIHENKLLFAKMCEEMRVTMKKGKQKNNATTRAGRKEGRTDRISLSDTGIPGSDLDQLSSHTCSICIKSV